MFSDKEKKRRRTIYRLSNRGSVSDAVREHNANMRFATRDAARRHRAHPLDLSRIVAFRVSVEEYHRLFRERDSDVADLRHLKHIRATRLRVRRG